MYAQSIREPEESLEVEDTGGQVTEQIDCQNRSADQVVRAAALGTRGSPRAATVVVTAVARHTTTLGHMMPSPEAGAATQGDRARRRPAGRQSGGGEGHEPAHYVLR